MGTCCVPAAQCLTTSLGLFTSCQPFLTALAQNGGGISKPTILALLQVAQNKTADVVCANSVLDFLNQGCVCSLTVYNTIQAFPTTTVPQLLKQGEARATPQMSCSVNWGSSALLDR